jgi:hypothetical protein
VAQVDPDDDEILRFVVYHYRYDPGRHERRHTAIAAFDNEPEFQAFLTATASVLRRSRVSGERVDPLEHISGVVHEPGYRRRQQNARLLIRATKRGASLPNVDELDLPANVGILRPVEQSRGGTRWNRVRERLLRAVRRGKKSAGWPSRSRPDR